MLLRQPLMNLGFATPFLNAFALLNAGLVIRTLRQTAVTQTLGRKAQLGAINGQRVSLIHCQTGRRLTAKHGYRLVLLRALVPPKQTHAQMLLV